MESLEILEDMKAVALFGGQGRHWGGLTNMGVLLL